MKLEHLTGMQVGCSMGMDKTGREYLVVCVKGTFNMPSKGEIPELLPEQVPLVEADIFAGEPGSSAPLYESDFAPIKPRCDILLNGSAYAAGGRPATRVPVGLQFGTMMKSFNVIGDRVWESNLLGTKPSWIKPFVRMPITYERAFGGVDDSQKDPKKVRAVMENPVGVGYHHYISSQSVDGRPLPNTEEAGHPVSSPDKKHRPMAFGPIGRGWHPRAALAGTYDQHWIDNIFPFLPPDFDSSYYQAAPLDQQIPYPQGGEPVILTNLTPAGRVGFPFPRMNLFVWFFLRNGKELEQRAVVDTVILEPDQGRFTVTCRTSVPLKKNMLEMALVVVGHDPQDKHKFKSDDISYPLTASERQDETDTEPAGAASDE